MPMQQRHRNIDAQERITEANLFFGITKIGPTRRMPHCSAFVQSNTVSSMVVRVVDQVFPSFWVIQKIRQTTHASLLI
jgi:hypothetical protein